MVETVGGYGVVEFAKEAGEMTKKRQPEALVPHEDPPWTELDMMIVPTSARLEIPTAGLSRYEMRRIGELVQQLGRHMVDLSHRHQMTERSIMFEAANAIRMVQHKVGPIRRAKRRTHREAE